MADRRSEEKPLAPRRTLSAPARSEDPGAEANTSTGRESGGGSGGESRQGSGDRRPISERVQGAVAAAGSAVQQARPGSGSGSGEGGRRTSTSSSTVPGAGGSSARRPRGPRRARLRLVHLDPWSVMKVSFLLSIALGVVTVVAVAVVWSVLGAAGVWDSINSTVTDVLGGEAASDFDVENYVGASRVLGFTMIVAVFDVLLITALATLGAFLYNLAAALLGGFEVTLAEDDR